MVKYPDQRKRNGLSHWRGPHTGRTPIITGTRKDRLVRCSENLIPEFEQWTAQTNAGWKVVIEKYGGIELRGLQTSFDG